VIEITHNFDPARFMWLWTKYVTGFNPAKHCTNAILGKYSKKLWKGNPDLVEQPTILLDEYPPDSYSAIYICGVNKSGYSSGKNYPHNVHVAVLPAHGHTDTWEFEGWRVGIVNGTLSAIPQSVDELPKPHRSLPPEFTACRIFRWAAAHFAGPHA